MNSNKGLFYRNRDRLFIEINCHLSVNQLSVELNRTPKSISIYLYKNKISLRKLRMNKKNVKDKIEKMINNLRKKSLQEVEKMNSDEIKKLLIEYSNIQTKEAKLYHYELSQIYISKQDFTSPVQK